MQSKLKFFLCSLVLGGMSMATEAPVATEASSVMQQGADGQATVSSPVSEVSSSIATESAPPPLLVGDVRHGAGGADRSIELKNLSQITPTEAYPRVDFYVDRGGSRVFETGSQIDEIFIVNEKIAEVKAHEDGKSFYIFGLELGQTQIYVKSLKEKKILQILVNVQYPVESLKKTLDFLVPDNNVYVNPLHNGVLLGGSVDSTKNAETIKKIAEQYVKDKETLINDITITTSTQISLKVKIAEVGRTSLNKLNLDWSGNVRSSIDNRNINLQWATSTNATNKLSYNKGPFNILVALDMLEQENKAVVLAEPTLVTLSGQSASFLSGGEVPYATYTSSGTGQSTPSIQFKKYGINLSFTPTLIGGAIHLNLKTEVSIPDSTLGLSQNGTSVPAFKTNTAETSVMLGNGQTLMIAGLSYNKSSNDGSRFPGLGNTPGLSALFDSEKNQNEDRELVIVVTPYTVTPMRADEKPLLPTDNVKLIPVFDAFFLAKRGTVDFATPTPSGLLAGFTY